MISFYTSQNKQDLFATIGFYTPDGFSSKNDNLDEQGIIRGHMQISEFNSVINLIQMEKLFVHWSDSLEQMWLDNGGTEPVGEAEA